MNRSSTRREIALFLTLAVALSSFCGCKQLITTAAFLIYGTDVDADCKELKEKKVAVVCRSLASLQLCNANVSRELGDQINLLLQKNVSKIKTIDQRKVGKWMDENTWEEFTEVGKAVKAEMVVGVDVEGFSLYQGQTLYQGRANATVRVYDMTKGGKMIFERTLPQAIYPPNSAVPTSDCGEPEFRREFEAVLAERIARLFYSHDPHADFGQDAAVLK